jgi:alpha-L-arabinofuranosidase
VYVGEYATWGNKLRNAIAEAAYMTGMERNGDVVRLSSYAPLFAKNNFTQWKTDMIFFDNVHVVPTPNYYVQKLFSSNSGDIYYSNVIVKDNKDSALAASCVQDSKTGDIILKLVNYSKEPKSMNINLAAFKKFIPDAEQTILTGNADIENSFGKPDAITPASAIYKVSKHFNYAAPAMSLTVIRIKQGTALSKK